jgi:hypothetical protein
LLFKKRSLLKRTKASKSNESTISHDDEIFSSWSCESARAVGVIGYKNDITRLQKEYHTNFASTSIDETPAICLNDKQSDAKREQKISVKKTFSNDIKRLNKDPQSESIKDDKKCNNKNYNWNNIKL